MSEFPWKKWGLRVLPAVLLIFGVMLGAAFCGGSQPVKGPAAGDGHDHASADAAMWTCSMHPQIRQAEPGQCPICGMDLIPVATSSGEQGANQIELSERAQTLAKVRTTEVRRQGDEGAQIRLLGRVEPNESTFRSVTAWTGGRIDRLHVNVTGAKVKSGQVIATLYSPEVFTAHQDLLTAKNQLAAMANGTEVSKMASNASLEASRERLRLLGVPDNELARMEGQSKPTKAVAIRSPFSGTVMERMATEGAYVMTGTPLYRVANLGTLWIQLDAYESDLPRLAVGQSVQIEVEAFSSEKFEGKITFIDPTVDAQRRTAKVRVEVPNTDGRLRPGMFAQAMVDAGGSEKSALVIPASAALFTGRRSIVYVEVPGANRPTYEPRNVRLGPRLGDNYPVVAGLSAGERVVSRGAFVLDADLQIKGGASMMSAPDDREVGAGDNMVKLSGGELAQLEPILREYLSVQRALAADDHAAAKAAADLIITGIAGVKFDKNAEAATAFAKTSSALGQHAKHVSMSKDIEEARLGFEGLSHAVMDVLRIFGNPLSHSVVLAHCPMALGTNGADWIQGGKVIDNSYFGESMRTCGDVVRVVDPGTHLDTTEVTK
jgi:Cu(I)/Ag(I) efflux system membrane fusion protein